MGYLTMLAASWLFTLDIAANQKRASLLVTTTGSFGLNMNIKVSHMPNVVLFIVVYIFQNTDGNGVEFPQHQQSLLHATPQLVFKAHALPVSKDQSYVIVESILCINLCMLLLQ